MRAIESRAYQNGRDDTVFGGLGRDVLVGGAGNDMLDGNEQDDLIFGDQIFLLRRVVETIVNGVPATNTTTLQDITSLRFQTLCGGLLYSRSDRTACGITGGENTSGVLLIFVDAFGKPIARNFRDPDSSGTGTPQLDSAPWWAEYLVLFDNDFADPDEFHSFTVDAGKKGAGSFGNDYLAGGAPRPRLGSSATTRSRATADRQALGGTSTAPARRRSATVVTRHVRCVVDAGRLHWHCGSAWPATTSATRPRLADRGGERRRGLHRGQRRQRHRLRRPRRTTLPAAAPIQPQRLTTRERPELHA